jgi:hypothetical protein
MAQKREEKVAQKKTSSPKANRLGEFFASEAFPWVARGVFFLVVFVILGFVYSDVLNLFFWRNYFLYDENFAIETIRQAGGLVLYLGRFLNQIFQYPVFAAFLLSVVLTVIQWWISVLYNNKKGMMVLTYIPSLTILLYLMQIKYDVYWAFEKGYILGSVIGFLYTLLVVLIFRKIGVDRHQLIIGGVLSLILYPLFGLFSLVPMVLVAFAVKERRLLWISFFFLLMIFFPFVSCRMFGEVYKHVVFSPIVDPYFSISFAISISGVFSLFAIAFISYYKTSSLKVEKCIFRVGLLLGTLGILGLVMSIYSSSYFRSEVKLVRLTRGFEWKKILDEFEEGKAMTHTQNAYRVIALANTGGLQKKLFDIPLPFVPNQGATGTSPMLYFYNMNFFGSLFSAALQMNMERWVAYGETNEELERFLLLALLNGEKELATRYLNVMKKCAGMDFYSEKYERYIEKTDLLYKENEVYEKIKYHSFTQNCYLNSQDFFLFLYSQFDQIPLKNMERRLLVDLYAKNLDVFIRDLMAWSPSHYKKLPKYFQEAISIVAIQKKDGKYLKMFNVEEKIFNDVYALYSDVWKNKGKDIKVLSRELYPKYSNMYSYYYFFCVDSYM